MILLVDKLHWKKDKSYLPYFKYFDIVSMYLSSRIKSHLNMYIVSFLNKRKCWVKEDKSQKYSENVTTPILICVLSDCITSQKMEIF